jgi:hypothetical protein
MNILPPPNWCPNDEQVVEFLKIKRHLMMVSSVEELREVLEKLTLPGIRIALNALDHMGQNMGRIERQNFRGTALRRTLWEEHSAEFAVTMCLSWLTG